jgi:hypothetical protein
MNQEKTSFNQESKWRQIFDPHILSKLILSVSFFCKLLNFVWVHDFNYYFVAIMLKQIRSIVNQIWKYWLSFLLNFEYKCPPIRIQSSMKHAEVIVQQILVPRAVVHQYQGDYLTLLSLVLTMLTYVSMAHRQLSKRKNAAWTCQKTSVSKSVVPLTQLGRHHRWIARQECSVKVWTQEP